MNFQNTNKILNIVLSVGDESGVGPEIILKALCSSEIPENIDLIFCLLYTSPSPRDATLSRMPSSA